MTSATPPAALPSLQAGGMTDTGRKRPTNQDSFHMDPQRGLFIVSDGMGGANGGEVASDMVVVTLREAMDTISTQNELEDMSAFSGPVEGAPAPSPHCSWTHPEQQNPALQALIGAVEQANAAVFEAASRETAYQGMGATVAAAFVFGGSWVTVNVGDSPIYLFRQGKIYTLFSPHTLEAALLHAGMKDYMPSSRAHHVLTKAVGVDPEIVPDYCELPIAHGDTLCLCSDGLSNMVSPEEIMDICQMFPAHEAAAKLVELANARGGDDNITVVLCKAEARDVSRHAGPFSRLSSGLASLFKGSRSQTSPSQSLSFAGE